MYSRLAIAGAGLYLTVFACAAIYPYFDRRTFSGLAAILLALPWIDYFPSIFLPAAVALNALIIYAVLAVLSHLPAWLRQSRR